jgi:hypothetical protein
VKCGRSARSIADLRRGAGIPRTHPAAHESLPWSAWRPAIFVDTALESAREADSNVNTSRCAGVHRPRHRERAWIGLLLAIASVVIAMPSDSRADEVQVPVALRAQLLAKVAAYDRHFVERAGGQARVLLLVAPGDAASERAATEMKRELGSIGEIAGLRHEEVIESYRDANALRAKCENDHVAIVFLGPGFAPFVDAIRAGLENVDVLTAGAVADYVPKGIVLGFDLVSGKPKLLVHLSQARKQKVDFSSAVLKLMRIYE